MRRVGLVADELQASPSGPARKVYALTDEGRARLRTWSQQWTKFVDTVNATLSDAVPPTPRS
jgi:PadR family transcriptional regulator PadR